MFVVHWLAPLCRSARDGLRSLASHTLSTVRGSRASTLGTDYSSEPFIYKTMHTQNEDVTALRLEQNTTIPSLLTTVQSLLCDKGMLLPRRTKALCTVQDKQFVFRVMQWNILAQGLSVGKDNFVRCPEAALNWDFRRLRLLEEILVSSPDILCLQEVDHYGFLEQVLGNVGYRGTFFPKPDSPALYVSNSNGPDGCSVFYKSSVFDEQDQQSFILKVDGRESNQVCVTVTLKPKCQSKVVTVAVTHLKAKHGWDMLRYKQGSYMLKYLEEKFKDNILVVCGDFNAESNEPVYEAFSQSKLGLESSFKALSVDGKHEPLYTTWKVRGGSKAGSETDVCRTIDYIWYSRDALKLVALKEFPTDEEIGPDRLPSFSYPSDHFSLTAEFTFK